MLIHGKERELLLTIQAASEISEMCPGGDLGRIDEILKLPTMKSLNFAAKMIEAMSRGYEANRKFNEPGYTPDPLTTEEIMALTMPELTALEKEALLKFGIDAKPSVELKESPKKEEGTGEIR